MTPPDEKRSVRDFWDERARDDNAEANQVTHPDVWQRWIEIELLKRQLRPDDDVLEVGCGNGYTTAHVAPLVRSVRAVDFSEAMIERAKSDCQDVRTASGGVPQFSVGDALRLSADDLGQFDLVTSQRCLINLPSWEDQQEALRRIASVTKPGGRFIMMEGCAQGRRALDEARERMGTTSTSRWTRRRSSSPRTSSSSTSSILARTTSCRGWCTRYSSPPKDRNTRRRSTASPQS